MARSMTVQGHVDMWCATIVFRDDGLAVHHEHIVIFYTKDYPDGERNKNTNTAMMALRELVVDFLLLFL